MAELLEQDIRKLLDSADHPTHTEFDPSSDWAGLRASVAALKPELERIAGRPFVLDDTAQDASFFADLSIQKPGPKRNWIDTVFALRFSNFGRLFTAWHHCQSEQLSDEVAAKLVEAVEHAGFRYIPAEALNAEYTGRNPKFAGSSWWIRFFDYV